MTSIFNDPEAFREDMTAGFVAAYGRYVEAVPGASGVMRVGGARAGKVSLIIGGGSGHYPAFCGTVGPGVADGAVMGDVFTSPSTEQAYRVAKALDGGAGVLFSYGNYAGDVLNFDAAQVRLRDEGIDCRTVLCTDDVSSASADEREKRRGVAGDLCVFKIAGAAADGGASLDEVEALAQRTNEVTRTFGVAFAGCTLPGQSEPLFTVEPGKIELGMGIHGEPGVRTADSVGAAELATMLVEPLLEERPEGADGRAAVLLNGLGATKYEELFVLYKDVVAALEGAGVQPVMPEVGELVTSLDMAGCSLTICWLDDELEALWKAPADTPAFRRGGGLLAAGLRARDRGRRRRRAGAARARRGLARGPGGRHDRPWRARAHARRDRRARGRAGPAGRRRGRRRPRHGHGAGLPRRGGRRRRGRAGRGRHAAPGRRRGVRRQGGRDQRLAVGRDAARGRGIARRRGSPRRGAGRRGGQGGRRHRPARRQGERRRQDAARRARALLGEALERASTAIPGSSTPGARRSRSPRSARRRPPSSCRRSAARDRSGSAARARPTRARSRWPPRWRRHRGRCRTR